MALKNSRRVSLYFINAVQAKDVQKRQSKSQPLERKERFMTMDYVFLCGLAWSHDRQAEAGWELVRACQTDDSNLRALAWQMLMAPSRRASAAVQAKRRHRCIRPSPADLVGRRDTEYQPIIADAIHGAVE